MQYQLIAGSPVGQVIVESGLELEEVRHVRDELSIPPRNMTILGPGSSGLRHPLIRSVVNVVVSDSGQTCGTQ